MQENVYISISGDKRQLTIDGDLALLASFLATLRGNGQEAGQNAPLPKSTTTNGGEK